MMDVGWWLLVAGFIGFASYPLESRPVGTLCELCFKVFRLIWKLFLLSLVKRKVAKILLHYIFKNI
ncbi:hypothetical protein BA768_11785 [Chryseobacterium sp. CBo1]|nr:hypothetical protein BA768_11785 [Chryseobacterium sp. CBo1]